MINLSGTSWALQLNEEIMGLFTFESNEYVEASLRMASLPAGTGVSDPVFENKRGILSWSQNGKKLIIRIPWEPDEIKFEFDNIDGFDMKGTGAGFVLTRVK
jgi:hypothetical protein